ncbi:hypothetical protein DER46DRAFT_578282 [Fusarium sp. MPI-SDFR-AT-0072]|nr:hypothetical protein DER46DRAFT_578282 [Fusarium sp. MPI-SDFR-AT-0072]
MSSRRHGRESNDPRSNGPRSNDPRSRDSGTNGPRPTDDRPQPGASGIEGQNQPEIKRLNEILAEIRLEIEKIYPLKEERVERVKRQNDRINRMKRDKRPKKEIEKATKELEARVDDMEGILKVLDQTRDVEEESPNNYTDHVLGSPPKGIRCPAITDRPRSRRARWEAQERVNVLNERLDGIRAEIDEIYRKRGEKEERVRRAKDVLKRLKAKRQPKRRDIEAAKGTLRRRVRDLKEIKRILKQTKR